MQRFGGICRISRPLRTLTASPHSDQDKGTEPILYRPCTVFFLSSTCLTELHQHICGKNAFTLNSLRLLLATALLIVLLLPWAAACRSTHPAYPKCETGTSSYNNANHTKCVSAVPHTNLRQERVPACLSVALFWKENSPLVNMLLACSHLG
jgi:hypothetical protein